MKDQIGRALAKGLVAGYGGKTKFGEVDRGGFSLHSSHYQDKEMVYHDEWTNNGGQELVKIGKEQWTRVYAGGVASKKVLQKLGISEKEIIQNLIERIREFKGKTRLGAEVTGAEKNGWRYEYRLVDRDKNVDLTVGKETIFYKNTPVFVHVFLLSPIK